MTPKPTQAKRTVRHSDKAKDSASATSFNRLQPSDRCRRIGYRWLKGQLAGARHKIARLESDIASFKASRVYCYVCGRRGCAHVKAD
jgi:hypothetical protein